MARVLKNRYDIVGVLGRGAMGSVYKVADRLQAGKIFAAKELKAGSLSEDRTQELLTQFQTEARILARLTHPNLPKVSDYFRHRGSYYMIMEYVEGRTLHQILRSRRGKPVDERLALSWALQICRAMHFLSVQKPLPIVFRDLKPSNIMIPRDDGVKLIDFGIARFFKQDKSTDTFVYGTPGYAAPEQYGTGQTDVRSDIFSLGATLHHCLTGRNPSENPLDFPDPRRMNPKLSRRAAAIIAKSLENDREKRFQSALEMKQAIQKVLLASARKSQDLRRVIYAKAGKLIKLPAWKKTCWVSVPSTVLGCGGYKGTLSTDELWIKPKPRVFGPDTPRLLFKVESGALKPGKIYRPRLRIHTDAGIFCPKLLFKKSWPWSLLEGVVAAFAIAIVVVLS